VINRVLQTRSDELLPAVALGTYLFLLVTTTVIGRAVRDALFLTEFTALQMTYADLQTIVGTAITIGVYFRLRRSLALNRLLITSSVFFAAADVACWWGTTFHQPWLTRAIYLCVGIQAAVTPPQVSVLAKQILTTRQAKRAVGVVGTGAILGWIVGGLVTRVAAGRTGTEALLLVMAGLTAVCPVLILAIGGKRGTEPDVEGADPSSAAPAGLLRSAAHVWQSPHLRSIACLVFVSAAVTTIAGVQFRAIASQSIGSTDGLTAFFGSFSLYAGLLSLATQVFLTSRVLQCFGIGPALAIAPVALAAGSVGILFSGSLAAAVFLKGSDQVMRYSIDRAALELLYVPLSPDETLEAKTFIESVVCRIGDGAGALAVILGASLLHLSFGALSILSLGLLAAWFGFAMRARRGYLEYLLAALRRRPRVSGETPAERTISTHGFCADTTAPDEGPTTATLRKMLQTTSVPQTIRRAIPHTLLRIGSHEAGRALVECVFEPDQILRLEILRALNTFQERYSDVIVDREPLTTALAAEIVGLYCLSESPTDLRQGVSGRHEYADSVERIFRLLKLLSPTLDLASAFAALQSDDARLKANALEYLENILKPSYRRLFVPLLELE
jgi:ATP/ADP translocase